MSTDTPELAALRERLKNHDWHFMMCERNGYAAGYAAEQELIADAARIPGGTELFKQMRYEMRGKYGLPNQ